MEIPSLPLTQEMQIAVMITLERIKNQPYDGLPLSNKIWKVGIAQAPTLHVQ